MSPKSFPANYVVRIYRFDENNPRHLVGVVEEVGVKGKKAFTNYDELWDILNSPKGRRARGRRGEIKTREQGGEHERIN